MLKISKMSDYAVIILSYLAEYKDHYMNAQSIAQGSNVPLATTQKLCKILCQHHLITSYAGASGGYKIYKEAHNISIISILEAVEGPIALTSCVQSAASSCDLEELCAMQGQWDKVNNAVTQALSDVSLQDMMASSNTEQQQYNNKYNDMGKHV